MGSSSTEPRTPRGAIGGASGDAGIEYQRAVAAYAVTHGLAGVPLIGFGVPTYAANVSAVSIETDAVVDDIAIEFSSGWRATVQAKRTLTKGIPFRSAIAQWKRAAEEGFGPKDSVVLVAGEAPKWAYDLRRLLNRYKTDRPGSPSKSESTALQYLDAELQGLTKQQREDLLKRASIHILFVEEEEFRHSRESIRLLDTVVGSTTSAQAWRDLVALAGRTARRRSGYSIEGWLDALLADGRYSVLRSEPTNAAQLMARKEARDQYCSTLKQRGSFIDLRLLGATIAPIPLDIVDAEVEVQEPESNNRETHDLLWAFLRRGRMVLTGLPGGGKSHALAVVASRLLDITNAPFPIVVSLREIDRRNRELSFRDRLLDVAVKELPSASRLLMRAELDDRLKDGGLALLLDSLDETYIRRAQVIAELHSFVGEISRDVDILLATRDVAYGYAATLGWPELRLTAPKEIARTVRTVLERQAASAGLGDTWIGERERWVSSALERDKTLKETPLLPILLSLLAATKNRTALPRHRASILYAVIKYIVARQESRQGAEFSIGALSGRQAAKALIEGFLMEAFTIASRGNQCHLQDAINAIRGNLVELWGIPASPAEVTAEAIVHFWDETGIFVISGADELVAPRIELFMEIGEAVQVTQWPEREISGWVSNAVANAKHEPLVLAAGLSESVSRLLLATAAETRDRKLLFAGITALREGAAASLPEIHNFIEAISTETRRGDTKAWRLWSSAVKVPLKSELIRPLINAIDAFPADHQIVARSIMLLRGHLEETAVDREALLLKVLRLRHLPQLPSIDPNPRRGYTVRANDLLIEAKEGAADELLGRSEEATVLVTNALENVPYFAHERLHELLRERGFEEISRQITAKQNAATRKAISGLLDFDSEVYRKILTRLAEYSSVALTYQEETRLDELADFCETLSLNSISAVPRPEEYEDWFWPLVDLVRQLGRFNSGILSAQARLTLRRMNDTGDNAPFFYIFDQAKDRELEAWDEIEDKQHAVQVLIDTFFHGRDSAWVAARALWDAPVADLVIPLLEEALPNLERSPAHQRIAALTLFSLTGEEKIEEWLSANNPILRRVAAQGVSILKGDLLSDEIARLLRDVDGHVVEEAVKRLRGLTELPAVRIELERVAQEINPGWMCLHCRTKNDPGARSCKKCNIVGSNPAALASAFLNGNTEPGRKLLSFDDLFDNEE